MTGFVGATEMLERLLEEELDGAGHGSTLADERAVRELCAGDGGLDAADAWLRGLTVERIRLVIQVMTMRFHLRNKAEQIEIAAINRERERASTVEAPRAESIAEAVSQLARAGASLDDVCTTMSRLDIQPTLTAHPTEARRRAVLRKQSHLADSVERLGDPRLTDRQIEDETRALRRVLLGLSVTDEVRSERLDAQDEVRNGLHFLTGSIWSAAPALYADLRAALATYFDGARPQLPTMLRYRSWIGGDRDGNPRVTPEVTRKALRQHLHAALDLYGAAVEQLRLELTVSTRRREASAELLEAIESDDALDAEALRHLRYEPYRVRLLQIRAKLEARRERPAAYSSDRFEQDLLVLRRSLAASGLEQLASPGPLEDLICRVRTFGLHLAALDVRQHSEVHEQAISEVLRAGGVTDDYGALSEEAKLGLLRAELASPRPLVPDGVVLGDAAQTVLDTMRVVADAVRADAGAIGSYVVSMTHEVSDVLEILVLARECGLYRSATGSDDGASLIDVAPLFETIDDLHRSESLLEALFAEPAYRAHLARRGDMQEVMLGYSDSNKDGGYWVANWLLHRAQQDVSRACHRAGLQVRLFHGRGGTVGRGGGRANRAILAAPVESHTGRIRFTEQGEVISFRYSLPAIAHRHLEQIVNAMLLATHGADSAHSDAGPEAHALMDCVASESMRAYRALIDDDSFWHWYMETTPVAHISRLPLASRPVMRTPGAASFDKLRAIPWVFAWTQIRATAPGWYGVGTALRAVVESDSGVVGRLREWAGSWPFLRAILANAEQEMARARLHISARYSAAAGFDNDDPVFTRVREEFELTSSLLLEITGAEGLLAGRPVIRDLIRARNPDTDVLNLCQIELMRRARAAGSDQDPELQAALLASLNGIAAAMQSTG